MKLYFQNQDTNNFYYKGKGITVAVPNDLTKNLNACESLEKLRMIIGFKIIEM
jgi:hypothetical protein